MGDACLAGHMDLAGDNDFAWSGIGFISNPLRAAINTPDPTPEALLMVEAKITRSENSQTFSTNMI